MSDPTTVYGSRLKGWWFDSITTVAGVVSLWTAQSGGHDLGQATAGSRPAATLTPASHEAIVIDQNTPKNLFYDPASAIFTGTAYQLAFAFKAGAATSINSGAVLFELGGGGITIGAYLWYDGTNTYLEIDSATGSVYTDSTLLDGNWHVAVLSVSTTGNATLYVDGSIPTNGTSAGFGGISSVTKISAGTYAAGFLGSRNYTASICSPCIATDTSNFTAGDATAITSVLQGYVSAPAAPPMYLDALTLSASGSVPVNGSASLTLAPLSLAINASAPLTLAPLTITAAGSIPRTLRDLPTEDRYDVDRIHFTMRRSVPTVQRIAAPRNFVLPAAKFSPRALARLMHWYRSDQGFQIDASRKVSRWSDIVSTAHAIQSTGANQPTYNAMDATFGTPSVQATSAGQFLLASVPTIAQAFTIWIIGGSWSTSGSVIVGLDGTSQPYVLNALGNVSANGGLGLSSGVAITSKRAAMVTFNGPTSFIGVDNWRTGGVNGSTGSGLLGETTLSMFALSDGSAALTGKLVEIVIQSGSPTAGEVSAMADYCYDRYGISVT